MAKERMYDQIDRLIHPDYFQLDQLWIEDVCEDPAVIGCTTNIPQKHRQEVKAKTNEIGIEDIRALHERLYEIGTGQYRCCVIRSAERMREAAGNALLKILEEPPKGVVFILTSEFPSLLLPTLHSRMRQLRFTRLSQDALKPLVKVCRRMTRNSPPSGAGDTGHCSATPRGPRRASKGADGFYPGIGILALTVPHRPSATLKAAP